MNEGVFDKYEIFIGLKDCETLIEKYSVDDVAKILVKYCKDKKM